MSDVRQEPRHRCPSCGVYMTLFVDTEKERKLDKATGDKNATYFRCEQCGYVKIVEK